MAVVALKDDDAPAPDAQVVESCLARLLLKLKEADKLERLLAVSARVGACMTRLAAADSHTRL